MSPTIRSYVIDECKEASYFSTTGGVIASPSYPNRYPTNIDCIYTISQPTGTVILLNFLSVDIRCNGDKDFRYGTADYLEIRNGPSAESPLLDKICGNEI